MCCGVENIVLNGLKANLNKMFNFLNKKEKNKIQLLLNYFLR